MTVKELIEKLKKHDGDMEVCVLEQSMFAGEVELYYQSIDSLEVTRYGSLCLKT